jgi:hypothetical protein
MSKKKQTWLDKKLLEVENWGTLTLLQFFKDNYNGRMEAERNTIFKYGTENYHGSNLDTHDRMVAAVNKVWDREFRKIYKWIEESNLEWKKSHQIGEKHV